MDWWLVNRINDGNVQLRQTGSIAARAFLHLEIWRIEKVM